MMELGEETTTCGSKLVDLIDRISREIDRTININLWIQLKHRLTKADKQKLNNLIDRLHTILDGKDKE